MASSSTNSRIAEEKVTVRQMVQIYCHGHHHPLGEASPDGLCPDCAALLDYAFTRLDHCRFGEQKTTCKKCPVHCYKPAMRQQMRQAMRYAGPRMMWYHPLAAIRHLLREMR